jgi:hypothetical protein
MFEVIEVPISNAGIDRLSFMTHHGFIKLFWIGASCDNRNQYDFFMA